jgi:hypothetical protein
MSKIQTLIILGTEKREETFPISDLLKQGYNTKQRAGSCSRGIWSVRITLDTQTWDQIHEHPACDSDAWLIHPHEALY